MKSMRVLAVIPARYASSRLPGKPLVDIGGKSMVQRVWKQASKATGILEAVVATDDERIMHHVAAFGGKAVMTSPDHPSGTDRCFEALQISGAHRFDAVVNVQGDEPFIEPLQIDQLCQTLVAAPGGIATLAQVVTDDHDLDDPGEVLITVNTKMDALYFSRAAIPFLRDVSDGQRHEHFRFLKHVGLYGYRSEVLEQLVSLKPSPLEVAEGLEQLRWVENGHKVRIGLTEHPSFCVDTPADLELARKRISGLNSHR